GFGRDRFDVGAVGKLRVGHDGGRVGVDEHDAVAFFLEGFAGLRAGVIELARLADDDRASAANEDAVDVVSFWHRKLFVSSELRSRVTRCGRSLTQPRSRIARRKTGR